MRTRRGFLAFTLVALPLGFFFGCTSDSNRPAGIRVTLVDGPLSGYQEINLDIQSVEIRGNGNWITLSTPRKVVNLLSLVGGVAEVLAETTLEEGRYGQLRLVLGRANTLKLADGTVVPLTVPSGLQSGVKLIVNFQVEAGTTKDVWIDFDAAHSIQVHGAGASGQYILRPTIWAYDKIMTGSISGRLTDQDGAPLAGAVVTAQVLAADKPTVARTVPTGADGRYTLNLLPVGHTYFVVSQPMLGTASYQAKASQGYALSATSPTFTYDASFTAAANTATVSATFATPVATDQHDVVDLLQTFTQGTFVVRTAIPVLNNGIESCAFELVPHGDNYAARRIRVTTAPDGSTTSVTTEAPTFSVGSGGATVAF